MAITFASLWGAAAAIAQPPPGAAMVRPPPDFDGLRPIIATHTIPPYPPMSVRLHEQGTAMMEVHITTEGAIDDCRIVQSSGSERLDTAACDHVKTNWRWQPPTASGRPVAVSTRVSVKWDLRDIVPPSIIETTVSWPPFPMAQWKKKPSRLNEPPATLTRLRIANDGTAQDCTVVLSSGSALLDQTACDHFKRVWRWQPAPPEGWPDATALIGVTWDAKNQTGGQFHLTAGALLITCVSQETDVRRQMCDAPLNLVYLGTLFSSAGKPKLCGFPEPAVQAKDQGPFRETVLSWVRDHPDVKQEAALFLGRDHANEIFACNK